MEVPMRTHPYLRAYMAGHRHPVDLHAAGTVDLPVEWRASTGRQHDVSLASLTQLAIFPGAFVPNLWGLWNMLHLRIRDRLRIPHAAFGALIPLILGPLVRFMLPTLVGTDDILLVRPFGMAIYYLVWKFAVGFLNREMGIA